MSSCCVFMDSTGDFPVFRTRNFRLPPIFSGHHIIQDMKLLGTSRSSEHHSIHHQDISPHYSGTLHFSGHLTIYLIIHYHRSLLPNPVGSHTNTDFSLVQAQTARLSELRWRQASVESTIDGERTSTRTIFDFQRETSRLSPEWSVCYE